MYFYGRCGAGLSKVCVFTVNALQGCQKLSFCSGCVAGSPKVCVFCGKCAAGLSQVCIFAVGALQG